MRKPKRLRPLIMSGFLCCTLSTAAMACDEPSFDVTIPDGKTASAEEMEVSNTAIQEAVKAGEKYVECINGSMRGSRADRLVNATLDQMQNLAAQFNRQLRYFRRSN